MDTEVKQKRKYVKVADDKFLEIVNRHGNAVDAAKEMGMSYGGVKAKCMRLHAQGKPVNERLFDRKDPVRERI